MTTSSRLLYSLFPDSSDMVNSRASFRDCVVYCCSEGYDGGLEEKMLLTKEGVHVTWNGVCHDDLDDMLGYRHDTKQPPPTIIAMSSDGRYFVQFEDGQRDFGGPVDPDFCDIMASDITVVSVSFGAKDKSVVVDSTGYVHWCGGRPASSVIGALRKAEGRKIQCIGLNPEHAQSYVIGFEDGGGMFVRGVMIYDVAVTISGV